MKAITTISVDPINLELARQKVGNISAYLNDCLASVADLPNNPLPEEKDELRIQLANALSTISRIKEKQRKIQKEDDPIVKTI